MGLAATIAAARAESSVATALTGFAMMAASNGATDFSCSALVA